MYTTFLFIHSWLRWIILALFLFTIIKSFMGMSGNKEYGKGDNALAASMVGTLHLQALIGLLLYFVLSPITINAFGGDVSPMKDAGIRYWAVEHIFMMIVAVVVAQIGRSKAKKKTESAAKFKTQAIYFTIALVLILSRIPWGEAERLFRF
jgi:cytochrome c biogenesis factor